MGIVYWIFNIFYIIAACVHVGTSLMCGFLRRVTVQRIRKGKSERVTSNLVISHHSPVVGGDTQSNAARKYHGNDSVTTKVCSTSGSE